MIFRVDRLRHVNLAGGTWSASNLIRMKLAKIQEDDPENMIFHAVTTFHKRNC